MPPTDSRSGSRGVRVRRRPENVRGAEEVGMTAVLHRDTAATVARPSRSSSGSLLSARKRVAARRTIILATAVCARRGAHPLIGSAGAQDGRPRPRRHDGQPVRAHGDRPDLAQSRASAARRDVARPDRLSLETGDKLQATGEPEVMTDCLGEGRGLRRESLHLQPRRPGPDRARQQPVHRRRARHARAHPAAEVLPEAARPRAPLHDRVHRRALDIADRASFRAA